MSSPLRAVSGWRFTRTARFFFIFDPQPFSVCVFLLHRGPDFPEDPPFPTYVTPAGQLAPKEDVWCPKGDVDPLHLDTAE